MNSFRIYRFPFKHDFKIPDGNSAVRAARCNNLMASPAHLPKKSRGEMSIKSYPPLYICFISFWCGASTQLHIQRVPQIAKFAHEGMTKGWRVGHGYNAHVAITKCYSKDSKTRKNSLIIWMTRFKLLVESKEAGLKIKIQHSTTFVYLLLTFIASIRTPFDIVNTTKFVQDAYF